MSAFCGNELSERSIRLDKGESSENMYERCGMGTRANGMKCNVVE